MADMTSNLCPACNKSISQIHRPISCQNCESLIHKRCINQLREVYYEDNKEASVDCPACGGAITSKPPVEMPDPADSEDFISGKLKTMFDEFSEKLLRDIDSKLDSKLEEFKKIESKFDSKLEDFKKDIMNDVAKEVGDLKNVNAELQTQVQDLKAKLEEMQRSVSLLNDPLKTSDGSPVPVYKELQQLHEHQEELNRGERATLRRFC